jgi:type I restriction enzyme S subunit
MDNLNVKTGYKQTDVGIVPVDWQVERLDQFWSVTDCKHITADFVLDGIPVASIKEVQSRFVDLKNANQTTSKYYSSLIEGGRKPQQGDLIFSRNATVGEVAQVADWHQPFAMGQDVCLLRKKYSGFSSDYLQSVLQSPIVISQLADFMVGSTFKRVNIEQIRGFVVPMPGFEEQRAIASALSDVDTLLTSLNKLIAKKRAIKTATMQQLLTGKKRLPGFEDIQKDGLTKHLEGSDPLTSWQKTTLGQALTLQRGYDLPHRNRCRGKIPIVSSSGITDTHNKALVSAPGVVTGRYGTIGEVFYIKEDFWPLNTTLFVSDFKGNDPLFISFLLRTIDFQSHSGKSGVPGVNRNDLHQLEIDLPPVPEQQAIAQVLSDMDTEITALETRLEKTKAIKQGMMQELLTGRTRLV